MIFRVSGVAQGAAPRGPAAGPAARSARMSPVHPAAACPVTLSLTPTDEKGSMTMRRPRAAGPRAPAAAPQAPGRPAT
jgi:hypothetical protein